VLIAELQEQHLQQYLQQVHAQQVVHQRQQYLQIHALNNSHSKRRPSPSGGVDLAGGLVAPEESREDFDHHQPEPIFFEASEIADDVEQSIEDAWVDSLSVITTDKGGVVWEDGKEEKGELENGIGGIGDEAAEVESDIDDAEPSKFFLWCFLVIFVCLFFL